MMATVEASRVSTEKASSLNGIRSGSSSKSSASELLSITEAAISALSKTNNAKVRSHVGSGGRFGVLENGIRLLSPTQLGPGPHDDKQCEAEAGRLSEDPNGQLSDRSHSTTPSEVLIGSTTPSHLDKSRASDVSRSSAASRTSSAFSAGRAHHVKLSSKRLKEIEPPLGTGVMKTKNHDVKKGNEKHVCKPSDNHDFGKQPERCTEKAEKSHFSEAVLREINDDESQSSHSQQTEKQGTVHYQDPYGSDDRVSNKETLPSVDSGYGTQAVKVVREKSYVQEHLDEEATGRDIPSLIEEISNEARCESPIDIIAKDQERQSSDTSASSDQPGIITVPEILVTVRATDIDRSDKSSSQTSGDSQQPSETATKSLAERLQQFHTSYLRQGTLNASKQDQRTSYGDRVHIAKTALTEKEKQLKEAFCKRDRSTQPVKKCVVPTVVQRELNPAADKKKPTSSSINEAATTAAVAAASAVAATQPFLKAQQDLEMRMAQLIERISTVQQQTNVTATVDNHKLEELQRQLNDLTQHRIQYLEDMQKQQLQLQAQFLGSSRTAAGKQVSPPGECFDTYGGRTAQRYTAKGMASDGREAGINQYRQTQNAAIRQEKSVLDTPAPRTKPPTPTVLDNTQMSEVKGHIIEHVTPERKGKASASSSGGLLAQILSQDSDTPQKSPFPQTPPSGRQITKRPDVITQQTENLARELADLKTQMKQVIADANQWKPDLPEQTFRVSPGVLDQTISLYDGPAPLDQYLNKVIPPPASPYPTLKTVEGNAPVISNFSDVQEVLKKVSLSRMILESNMDVILRNRKLAETCSLLDTITRGSPQAERIRIQKMVDKHITSMNSNMEKEVLDELLKVEETKKSVANFMIPERDTTNASSVSKVKVTGPKARLRTEARADMWMNKRQDRLKAAGVRAGEKENVPQKKTMRERQFKIKVSEDQRKTQIIPQRRTQKEPYLRFRSTSPKALSPKIIGRPVEAKGKMVSTVKSQIGNSAMPQGTTSHQQQAPPPLIPMAVPLGAPRKDGGLKTAIFFPSLPPEPASSTPKDKSPPRNVGVLIVKDKDLKEEEELKQRLKKKLEEKSAKLEKMILPSVDVDSFQTSPRSSHASSPRSKMTSQRPEQSRVNTECFQVVAEESVQSSEADDTLTEMSDSAAIDLPGYSVPPSTAYHGPSFPPQAPPPQAPSTSNVMVSDIRRQDLLQQQALDWVEQELMAKVISDFYVHKQDAVPHTPTTTDMDKKQKEEEDIQSEISEVSSHESFIAEGLGQDGFQLFVDAGQPVDEDLVNALFKEVLLEKIASTLGQKTAVDDEKPGRPSVVKGTKKTMIKMATKTSVVTPAKTPDHQQQIDSPIEIPSTPIPTPQPTPQHSPPPTVTQQSATAIATPEWSPSPSPVEQTQDVVTVVTAEAAVKQTEAVVNDEESTTDESEETRFNRIIECHAIPPTEILGVSGAAPHHEVLTPNTTPPQSPLPQSDKDMPAMRTPSPSTRTPSPEPVPQPAPVQKQQQQQWQQQPQPTAVPSEPVQSALQENTPSIMRQQIKYTTQDEGTQADTEPEKPLTCSVAIQAEHKQSSPPPPSPKIQERHLSTSSTDSVESSSPVSETINERLSEGQWLVTLHSEGEIPDIEPNQDLYGRIRHLLGGQHPVRVSGQDLSQVEDTLMDTDDLEPEEETGEFPQSEGEFHPSIIKRPAGMGLIPQLELISNMSVQKMGHPTAGAAGVDLSLGEVPISSHRSTTVPQGDQTTPTQPQTRGQVNGKPSRSYQTQKSLGEISEENEVESPKVRTVSVKPQTSTDGATFKGHIRPITVTAGGREPSRHARSGLRQRSYQTSRSFSPETTGGATRVSDKFSETVTSQTSLLTTSDLDTQTSDQINVQHLLQSHDYFTNTQTDFGSTGDHTELGQSERLTYSITQSEELRIQSLVHQQSPGSTSDMSLAPGLTKTLERSEEELAQDSRQSCDDDSDLRAPEGGPAKAKGPPGDGGGPLQVSVTIPSVGEEDSQTQESFEDVSEISLV